MLPVEQPFKTYTGLDGKPLDNGYVYFGLPDQDPIAHPVEVYWDAAGTLPAAQPLRTLNGYIMNTGTPANVFFDGSYSELVNDSKGRLVFYARSSDEFSLATTILTFLTGIAAAAGASLMGFIQAGMGAVKRTVQDKLRETPSIADLGALGDGLADDAVAINKALADHAGKAILMPDPAVAYRLATPIVVPPNTTLYGQGKRSCLLKKAFNGDAFVLQDGASIRNATIDLNGTNFTGRGLVLSQSDGRQSGWGLRVINGDGACLDFSTVGCGSQSTWFDCEFYRVNAGTGTGRYAITMANGQQLSAVPRKFSAIETSGTCAIDFGGCNDVFVEGSFLGDLAFKSDSRGVNIVASRIANQLALTVDGHNNSIVGCDVGPQITIAAGADAITIGPGSFNNLPVVDNSGSNRNSVHHWVLPYTPTFSSGGTAPTLGNGSISGEWSRQGHQRQININFTVGSTTNLGSGPLRFGLPEIHRSGQVAEAGTAVINRGGTIYTAVTQIPGNASYCELLRDTSGSVTFNSPSVFAAGDTIRISIKC